MLYNKFPVVLIDKVSGNAVFVCQRHHTQLLISEIALNHVNNIHSTFTIVTKPVGKIVSENTSLLKNKLYDEVTVINKNSPIYTGLLNYIKILLKQGL